MPVCGLAEVVGLWSLELHKESKASVITLGLVCVGKKEIQST